MQFSGLRCEEDWETAAAQMATTDLAPSELIHESTGQPVEQLGRPCRKFTRRWTTALGRLVLDQVEEFDRTRARDLELV